MKPIVFLDFDGVLNSSVFLGARHRAGDDSIDQIDPEAVARLSRIVSASGADVVISSTWRLAFTLADLRGRLNAHGFTGRVIDRTPNLPDEDRAAEILAWLADPPRDRPETFVIVDDDGDAGLRELAPHFVRTDFTHGLQDRHVERALRILGVTS